MDRKKLQALVIDAREDVKAQDIRIYDTTHLTSMFDSIVV
ncbi:MAG: ribosome silencing factor, partial [Burkholderiaceae bacterium]